MSKATSLSESMRME